MSGIQVDFHGFIFDPINDDEARMHAARKRAADLMHITFEDEGDVKNAALGQLENLLTGLLSWHIQSAATLCIAHAGGAAGITLQQALDQHNYIGQLIGEDELFVSDAVAAPTEP